MRKLSNASPGRVMHAGAAAAGAKATGANVLPSANLRSLYEGQKLFWQTREKLEIKMFESRHYDVLVVTAYNEARAMPAVG